MYTDLSSLKLYIVVGMANKLPVGKSGVWIPARTTKFVPTPKGPGGL